MSQPRHERTSRLSPILAVTAILGSAAAFVYVAVEALGQLG
jgi:pyrroline-5-carboxylate reductase